MRKCREIVQIIASGEKLNLKGRIELKMHLMMCRHCSRFAKHLGIMKVGFVKLFKKITEVDRKTVEEVEEEVLRDLRK